VAAYEGPVFGSLAEVEQHFREHYLPGLIRTASSFHLSGEASRSVTDRGIAAAVRQAWEQERGFPGQMMHQLRQQFSRSGLHIFKHRKRMQFVSLIRPSPMEDGSLSASVAEILQVIQGNQNCNRASLAAAVLGADESAVDPARKATLAADFRWLIETGRVIEFSDGRLELPVAPAKPEAPHGDHSAAGKAKPAEAGAGHATTPAPEPAPTAAAAEMPALEAAVEPERPISDPAPEEGYEPAEPVAKIAPADEQEPIHMAHMAHVAHAAPVEETPVPMPAAAEGSQATEAVEETQMPIGRLALQGEPPAPAAISQESPAAES